MKRLSDIEALLETAGKAIFESRQRDKATASGFSVFTAFLPIDENRISDILAWMLNPAETHAQGAAFLSAFLAAAGIPPQSFSPPVVRREAVAYSIEKSHRRMDIVVDWPEFALAIETKRDSAEQPAQATDYIHHLSRIRRDYRLVYLTKEGKGPPSVETSDLTAAQKARLILCDYPSLATWADNCAAITQAPAISHFLRSFKQFILSEIDMSTPSAPPEVKNAITNSPKSIEAAYQIFRAWRETVAEIGKVFTDNLDARLAPNWKVERGSDCFNDEWGGINIHRKGWGPYRVRFETACQPNWQAIFIGIHKIDGQAGGIAGPLIAAMKAMTPSYNAKLRREYWEAAAILAEGEHFWWTPDFLSQMKSGERELIENVAGRMEEIADAVDKIIRDAVKNQ